MIRTIHTTGVTFVVDEVALATTLLPEVRAHEVLKSMSGVESCSDYHTSIVKDVRYHPLLAAVFLAYSQHRPLVLSPDAVWLTIAQGVAQHMVIHGERLRPRFVDHQGKLDLIFECNWIEGSPENPWPDAFASWSGQIREHVGAKVHDTLMCDFSTTGPVERAVSDIVIMDVFERYFHYIAMCICGIPSVSLEGTPDDWQRLANKAARLEMFELEWWLKHLLPICEQFVRASRGDVDVEHWRGICKRHEAYGGDIINGWVAKLFPYVRAFAGGPCNVRNPIFQTGAGIQSDMAPRGLSRVPFTWRNQTTGLEKPMEAIGGHVGIAQDPQTMALRPHVGWAVRNASALDVVLLRLEKDHVTFPGAAMNRMCERGWPIESGLPADLATFYHRTNGAELFGRGKSARCRIVPLEEIEVLDWGEKPFDDGFQPQRVWRRFAWLADGSWLAINTYPKFTAAMEERLRQEMAQGRYFEFQPICHGSATTQTKPGLNPVIAHSFTEFCQRFLGAKGAAYWLASDFKNQGDAEDYTRRY